MTSKSVPSVRSKTGHISRAKAYTAFGLAAAGVVGMAVGTAQSAHADDAPYTLVAWQVTAGAGHELDADQRYITSLPGATSVDALDEQVGTLACGDEVQFDLYRDVDGNGTPVSSLWADGYLHPNHDGGFLAYNLMAQPYKLVEEPACQTATPTPTGTPSTGTPSSTPTSMPSTPVATPTSSATPSAPVTSTPAPTPTPITSVPAPVEVCTDGRWSVTVPKGTAEYWYLVERPDTPSPREVVVAVANDGYVFAAGVRTEWVFAEPGTVCGTGGSSGPTGSTPTATPTVPAAGGQPAATSPVASPGSTVPTQSTAVTRHATTRPAATELAYTGTSSAWRWWLAVGVLLVAAGVVVRFARRGGSVR